MEWDLWALRQANGLAGRSATLDGAAVVLARWSSVAEVALALALPLAAGWPGAGALARAGVALLLATGLVRLLQRCLPRRRPFMDGATRQLVARRPGPSFPSRHVASAFALAVPAWSAHRPIGGAMLTLGALLGLSRVYSGLHYPSDVLAGAAIGIGCGQLVGGWRLQVGIQPATSTLQPLSPAPPALLLATTHPAKRERLAWMVEGLPLRVLTPEQVAARPVVEERGANHRQVAEAKALAWSRAVQGLALASDGGVDIPALGARWEALLTRRAAGSEASDEQRAAHLLALLGGLRGEQRQARWREAAALAARGRLLGSWEVESSEPMRIAERYDPSGVPLGFWVPGLLEFPRLGRRYGQLSPAERERALDHWARLRPLVRAASSRRVQGE
ncbi:MAG: phosphatase PAP2 family protein [Chloroflexi bacterium]|nr:phosphatase PAP2 family protein [Chloroflexota bacterium]